MGASMQRTRRIIFAICLLLFSTTASAREFGFRDLKGKNHALSEYRGKWVLVNFWATWCPPCQDETPDLVALHNAHKDSDLVVVGISLDSERNARKSVERFADQYKISYTLGIGSYTMAAMLGENEISALPTSFLIDPNGAVVGYQEGAVTRSAIETFITQRKQAPKK